MAVNKRNILKVAKAIEDACKPQARPRIGFNMGSWVSHVRSDKTGHNCGTTACIGGWTGHVLKDNERISPQDAADLLGLTPHLAASLFYGVGVERDATPQRAVAVLRNLAETGRVNWRAKA